MRSLKDFMLEQSVLNFGEIFSKEKQNVSFEVENETFSGIYLPPGVFDMILTKSKEMSWKILPEELHPCLDNMEKLQWKDLSYFTERVLLRPKDVRFICRKKPTMKSLSVQIIYSDAREISECLSDVVGSLENLELTLIESQDQNDTKTTAEGSGINLRPFRLKRLSFNLGLNRLPLIVEPELMERLDLREAFMTLEDVDIIKRFKNLKHLNLNHVFSEINGKRVIMAMLEDLKALRTIILTGFLADITSVIDGLIETKNVLEIIDVSELDNSPLIVFDFPERKHKFFVCGGLLECPDTECFVVELDPVYCIHTLVEYSKSSFYELLSIPERIHIKHEVYYIIKSLRKSFLYNSYNPSDAMKMEELLITCLDYEIRFDTLLTIKSILDCLDMDKFSTDFKIKLISRMCSLAPIGDIALNRCAKIPVDNRQLNAFLLDFIEKNAHKRLAKKISESFRSFPETFEGSKVVLIVELSRASRYEFEQADD